jgi:hypothetical protein
MVPAAIPRQADDAQNASPGGAVPKTMIKNSDVPVVKQVLSGGPSPIMAQRSGQTPTEAPPVGRDPSGKVQQKSKDGPDGLRSGKPSVSPDHGMPAGGQVVERDVVPSKEKESPSGVHKDATNVRPELSTLASGLSPAPVAPQPVALPQTQMPGDAAAGRDLIRNVGDQILDSVQASLTRGDRQIVIRLHPPELGTVLIRFREQGEQIDGTVDAGRPDTRREIEQALPQVLRSLQDAGVPIRRFDVVTSDLPEKDFGRGQPQQDSWPQPHNRGQGREHFPTPQAPWSPGVADYAPDVDGTGRLAGHVGPVQGHIDVLL